jgi:hypothetical protein
MKCAERVDMDLSKASQELRVIFEQSQVAITLEVYLKKNDIKSSTIAVETVETQETAASTPPP